MWRCPQRLSSVSGMTLIKAAARAGWWMRCDHRGPRMEHLPCPVRTFLITILQGKCQELEAENWIHEPRTPIKSGILFGDARKYIRRGQPAPQERLRALRTTAPVIKRQHGDIADVDGHIQYDDYLRILGPMIWAHEPPRLFYRRFRRRLSKG